jgi:adenosine deaminase
VFGYRFAEDTANFSISTDDPMVTGQQLQGEYDLVNHWGLTEADLLRAVSNICNYLFQFFLSN